MLDLTHKNVRDFKVIDASGRVIEETRVSMLIEEMGKVMTTLQLSNYCGLSRSILPFHGAYFFRFVSSMLLSAVLVAL